MTLSKELRAAIKAHPPSADALRDLAQLREMTVPQLAAEYEQLFGKAPRMKHRAFLVNRCAWRREEQRTGGLSELARRRLEELVAKIKLPIGENARTVSGQLVTPHSARELKVGTVLVRMWHGQRVEVRVVERGFEWNGTTYKSLSAAAGAITGQHWSGALFFNLRSRRRSA